MFVVAIAPLTKRLTFAELNPEDMGLWSTKVTSVYYTLLHAFDPLRVLSLIQMFVAH